MTGALEVQLGEVLVVWSWSILCFEQSCLESGGYTIPSFLVHLLMAIRVVPNLRPSSHGCLFWAWGFLFQFIFIIGRHV